MPSFARDTPKEIKPFLGRSRTSETPLEIHSKFSLGEAFRQYIRAHLGRALDPYAWKIERILVHFEDANGTKGGVDTVCRVHVVMSRDEPVLIEEIGTDAEVAFNVAVHRVERNVQRHIERRSQRHLRPNPRSGTGKGG